MSDLNKCLIGTINYGNRGPAGPKGDKGDPGTFSSIEATIDGEVGTPSITVEYDGDSATFNFHNLKGVKGDTGPQGEIGPEGPQGLQGNPGEQGPQGPAGQDGEDGSQVSVSSTGTATTEVKYITIDNTEYKIAGGAVDSVNGQTGTVVLKDDDIHISDDLTDTKTIHSELERIDTALNGKQDTLTAGTNITIVDNVISATGGQGGGYEPDNKTIVLDDDGKLKTAVGGYTYTEEQYQEIYAVDDGFGATYNPTYNRLQWSGSSLNADFKNGAYDYPTEEDETFTVAIICYGTLATEEEARETYSVYTAIKKSASSNQLQVVNLVEGDDLGITASTIGPALNLTFNNTVFIPAANPDNEQYFLQVFEHYYKDVDVIVPIATDYIREPVSEIIMPGRYDPSSDTLEGIILNDVNYNLPGGSGGSYEAGAGIDISSNVISSKHTYQTNLPSAAATDGCIHIVYRTSEPSTKRAGYIYLIAEEE